MLCRVVLAFECIEYGESTFNSTFSLWSSFSSYLWSFTSFTSLGTPPNIKYTGSSGISIITIFLTFFSILYVPCSTGQSHKILEYLNLRRCNCCVVFVGEEKKFYKFATPEAFFSVTSNLLIHVWLFSTSTNSTVTHAQMFCSNNTFIMMPYHSPQSCGVGS